MQGGRTSSPSARRGAPDAWEQIGQGLVAFTMLDFDNLRITLAQTRPRQCNKTLKMDVAALMHPILCYCSHFSELLHHANSCLCGRLMPTFHHASLRGSRLRIPCVAIDLLSARCPQNIVLCSRRLIDIDFWLLVRQHAFRQGYRCVTRRHVRETAFHSCRNGQRIFECTFRIE